MMATATRTAPVSARRVADLKRETPDKLLIHAPWFVADVREECEFDGGMKPGRSYARVYLSDGSKCMIDVDSHELVAWREI